MTWSNPGASPAWPGVRRKHKGRQWQSAARWIFVVSRRGSGRWHGRLARWLGPLFAGPGGVLVGADDGGVDSDDPVQVALGVRLSEQGREHPLPCPVDGPVPQPGVDALPRPVLSRQMDPLRTGLELPRDRVDHLPVITPPPAPPRRPVRQQRLDPRPLRVS